MNSAWPGGDDADRQPIELRISVISLFDIDKADGVAAAFGGTGIELARTPVGTVAVDEFATFDGPFCLGHCLLPFFDLHALVNRAPLGMVYGVELAICVVEIQQDRIGRRRRCAGDFRNGELYP